MRLFSSSTVLRKHAPYHNAGSAFNCFRRGEGATGRKIFQWAEVTHAQLRMNLKSLTSLAQCRNDLLVGFRKGVAIKLIQRHPANGLAAARLCTASHVAAVEGVQRDAKM